MTVIVMIKIEMVKRWSRTEEKIKEVERNYEKV